MIKDCNTCIHEYRSPMSDVCRECGIAMRNYKERSTPAPTNADHIRAMSDEDLATFFGTLPCCPPGNADELCFPDNTCGADTKMMVKCWANWLKSPVEEVDE